MRRKPFLREGEKNFITPHKKKSLEGNDNFISCHSLMDLIAKKDFFSKGVEKKISYVNKPPENTCLAERQAKQERFSAD